MTYHSCVNLPPRVPTPAGDVVENVYELCTDKETGRRVVRCTGQRDISAEVQACKADCDLRELIKRYEAGDDKAFNIKAGFYGDTTDLSGLTMADVSSRISDLRVAFETAPRSYRAAFSNDFDVFVKRQGVVPAAESAPAAATEVKEVKKEGETE